MTFKCPGSQKFSQPQPEIINCPFCGKEIEIWTDEIKATCPNCKKQVIRNGGATCLDWCRYARECVGDEVYNKYMKTKEKSKGDKHDKQKDVRKPKRAD